MLKCSQCNEILDRNKIPFHIRDIHGPKRPNTHVPPAQTPPHPDLQQVRKSFTEKIQHIVREFNPLPSEVAEQCCQSIRDMPVLVALYAYTFTHLKLCAAPTQQSCLDELENLKTRWIRKGDACLFDLKTIKDDLVLILRKSQVNEHICNARLINQHRLHDLDINNIAALIVERTLSEEHAHSFYVNDEPQYMVDTLHNLLMIQSEEIEKYRTYLLNAIMKLSRKSGRFPRNLQLCQIHDLEKTDFCGGFGVISQGKLSGRVVAVKEVKKDSRSIEHFLKDFANEAVVWCYARHPNCLPFYGVIDDGSTKCLVAPWITNGHVRDYLKENPHTHRLPLILDVACGLEYLHSMHPPVIHGDLKGANILITSSGRACLADFGMVTVRDSNKAMTTATFKAGGTTNFMAPELLLAESNDDLKNLDKCDIYAFGCVCYEMYTGKAPFEESNAMIVIQRRRPKRPSNIQWLDDAMWRFIEDLWCHDPMRRPTAAKAYSWIASKMTDEGKSTVRPSTEVEWDIGFLVDATVTMEVEDPFVLAEIIDGSLPSQCTQ